MKKIGKGGGGKGSEKKEKARFNPYSNIVEVLDDIEKRVGITEASLGLEKRTPTGMLCLDLILGGGISPGLYTHFGQEQTCKSTSVMLQLLSGVKHGVPIISQYDYEGCVTEDTTLRINGKDIKFKDIIEKFSVDEKIKLINTIDGITEGTLYYGGEKSTHIIELEDSPPLEGYGHPILVWDPAREEATWVLLENITPGDIVLKSEKLGLKPIKVVASYPTNKKKKVWDVKVLGTEKFPHSIITNGIITHNSQEPTYTQNMMKRLGLDLDILDVFGEKDNKGKYIRPPLIRYRSEAVAEKFFDFVAELERRLPDKKMIGDEWWYIYDDSKKNRAIVGDKYDKSYFRDTGKLRIKAQDGSLQAMISVDSYPAMVPESEDTDEGPGNAMAIIARMFSKNIPRIKGRLRSKRIAILGVNQLGLNPAARFGNPEYEKGGQSLKFFSDVRLRYATRALSGVPEVIGEKKGPIEKEESVEYAGEDSYRYIYVTAIKNKLSIPYLSTYLRLWISDANGDAQGFDPVWDTYWYLHETGQVVGNRRKMRLVLGGNESKKSIGWSAFKKLVIGSKKQIKKICLKCKMKPVRVRVYCQKQMASGKGLDLYSEYRSKQSSKPKPPEGNGDDD